MDNYRNTISRKIKSLPDKKKVIFALLTCEKLLPNYIHFSETFNFGNPGLLKQIISGLYENVLTRTTIDLTAIENLRRQVEEITPDTEDFDTVLVSFALDACTSILSTLDFLKTDDPENITDVACYGKDTVDMYIQELYHLDAVDPNVETLIDENQFMIREKKRQISVISKLLTIDSLNIEKLEGLRSIETMPIIDLGMLS